MPLANDSQTLSEFRGTPYAPPISKARKTRGVPVLAGSFTNAVLASINEKLKYQSTGETVARHWNECIDARLVGKCSVNSVRANIVFVAAANAQVRQMLAFAEKRILAKIVKLDGCKNVAKIRFV